MKFQVEPFHRVRADIERLMHEHWLEVSGDPTRPLDVRWEQFYMLDDMQALSTLTARTDEGIVVGYVIHIIFPSLHYGYLLCATDDAHFLQKSHRRGLAGIRMLQAAERELKSRGVGMVTYHTKTKAGVDKSRVFERLGYHAYETNMMKRL